MSRYIDADALDMYECLKSYYGDAWRDAQEHIDNAPTIRTKTVKYFDEDERVWTVGEVIVNE